MDVLEVGGAAAVEWYPLQGLTWEQVKELKGPNLIGLGMGSGPAPGSPLVFLVAFSFSQQTACFLGMFSASWESKDL